MFPAKLDFRSRFTLIVIIIIISFVLVVITMMMLMMHLCKNLSESTQDKGSRGAFRCHVLETVAQESDDKHDHDGDGDNDNDDHDHDDHVDAI